MHTIKFRGKSLSTGEWVYGYYYATPLHFLDKPDVITHCIIDTEGSIYKVDPNTVGQYIGVKDKKEREIYSDDIYIIRSYLGDDEEDYNNKYLVGYKDFSDCCVNGIGYSFGEHGSPADIEQIEVIGNLTDNPTLLTQ